jgi:L-fuculose-phosphate aldolase
MANPITFDESLGKQFIHYARLVARRGYIHNTLGNIAMRVDAPGRAHGVAYTKPAQMSLEEVTIDDLVITDIPTSEILHGDAMTSVGHNLNRKILEERPDTHAVIHVHDDHTIAFLASGGFDRVGVVSLDFPFIHGKPAFYLAADVDVESDTRQVASFIQDTNCLVLLGHGVTTLGRTVSEAYHRLNSFTSEVRRNILAEQLAALKGTAVAYRPREEIDRMYRLAEQVIYPDRAENVMEEAVDALGKGSR